jgi:precorrin-2 dehydrogenase/sirohydrochlorin ferrochelatase
MPQPENLQNSYPIQLLIRGRRVLVVGAGHVAHRKITGLLEAGADVTVVAPFVRPKVAALPVDLFERPYASSDIDGFQLVITCTDDREVNRQVFRDAEALGIWANSADDPINCSFILPSVARQGDLTITTSTNGRSPALAMWLRRRFEAEFDHSYDRLLDLLAEVRAEARYVLGTSEVSGWLEALDGGVYELVAAGDLDQARQLLRGHLGLPAEVSESVLA